MLAERADPPADRAAIATATGFIGSIFIGTARFAKADAKTIEDARARREF